MPSPTGPVPGPVKPANPSPYTGRTIARCKVGERLGRGATSHVFRAFYEPLNKDVALKILSKEAAGSEEMRTRFLSEARAVAKLNHENIVKILNVVEDQGLLCILMELAEGPTLQDRLDDEQVLSPGQSFRIAAQIARALEAAHEEKVVHRDVKPANVMLVGKPGDETVKVVDFGLAAQQEMNRVGTPLFMSPEAAQGKRIDEKSDVYALGVCLYRMLTGHLPFTGATVKEILAAHVNADLMPPSERRPQLGKAYDDLLKKMLVKSKGYRPSSAEVADVLEDLADDIQEREEGVRRVRRKRQRSLPKKKPPNPMPWVALAVVAVVVVAVALLMSGGKPPPPPPALVDTAAPAVVNAAEKAFSDTEQWMAANPWNPAEAARRWGVVEQQFPGTKSGTVAGQRRVIAEKQQKDKELAEQEAADKREAEAKAAKDPVVKASRFESLVKSFQFPAAFTEFEQLEPPAGVNGPDWDRRGVRIEFLAKHFTDKMDAGLSALRSKLKAKAVFPDAKENETIVGANSAGAVVFDGNQRVTVSWAKAPPSAFFAPRVIKDNVLDTQDYEATLVLACLAAELGQTDALKKLVGYANGHASDDDMRRAQVKSLFGD